MSHPCFKDWGNGRVRWGPENSQHVGCFVYPFAVIQTICLSLTEMKPRKVEESGKGAKLFEVRVQLAEPDEEEQFMFNKWPLMDNFGWTEKCG